mmetsp:Transcript_26810/g.51983  ORF Transcript_26810/g.51983 Transcript_26810/m.51983 type:complete len:92 (-) Transcript_26810:264-539(-)
MKSVDGWVLFVTGIHEEATEDDIYELFEEYGSIQSLDLPLNRRTGYVKGYAVLDYKTFAEARSARNALHKAKLLERIIRVNFAFKVPPRKK